MEKTHEAMLRAIIRRWRDTAHLWEAQLEEKGSPYMHRPPGEQPPDYGRASIGNWMNWLRAMAQQIEDAINTGEPTDVP